MPIMALGPDEYLEHLRLIKSAVRIPVMASLNGVTPGGWMSYARLLEEAGADGLELHLYHAASDMTSSAAEVERQAIEIVREVKRTVRIPVAVKTRAAPHRLRAFRQAARLRPAPTALVLFTRFHRVDIDVDELEVIRTLPLSDSSELPLRLRGGSRPGRADQGVASRSPAASTPGSTSSRPRWPARTPRRWCPRCFVTAPSHLRTVRQDIESWMQEHEWSSLSEMRGNMSFDRIPDPGRLRARELSHGTAMKTVQTGTPMAGTVTPGKDAATTTGPWQGFQPGLWQKEINVRDFIQQNYEPYDGDGSFLTAATPRTQTLWAALNELFVEERRKGVLDVSQIPSSITAHQPGYIDRDNEIIVGLQTDAPLKRAIMPNGGLRLVLNALKAYGYEPDPHVVEAFTKYRKTHNDAVFDAYTADVRRCRSSHILTGLPDAYGRGRIIGDYRRVALYGVARLIERKQEEKNALDSAMSTDDVIRDREELAEQIRALKELQQMASIVRVRHFGPCEQRPGSRAMAVLRLSGRGEGAEWRRDVTRAHLHVPRYLLRAGPGLGPAHRITGPGNRRRLRHQASHRPLPAHARVRRAVRRRSHVGDRVDRRDGRRRPAAGHQEQLPLPADPLQPRPRARTEPDDLVFAAPSRWIPALRRQGGHRHQLDPVRKRRDHAARLGRRRCHCLLRVADGGRQTDAILRRPRQPRQMPALRDQRRQGRDQRRPDRAGLSNPSRAMCSTSTTSSTSSSE